MSASRTRLRLVCCPDARARARAAYHRRRAKARLEHGATRRREFTINTRPANDPAFHLLPTYRGLGTSVLAIARAAGLDLQLDGDLIEVTGFGGLPARLRRALQFHCVIACRPIREILEEEEASSQ